jgi:AAA+ superfamily predicted ATPase
MSHENFPETLKNRLIQKTIEYEKNNSLKNPLFYSFQIFRLTILKTSLNVLDYKEAMQENIFRSLTTLNLICFWLSIAPILWFLVRLPVQKSDPKISVSFFTQNFPGLSNTTTRLNWETFIYPFDYTEALINGVDQLSLDNELLILKHNEKRKGFNTFIEVEQSINQKNLKEFNPRKSLKTSQHSKLDFDEIPLKVEGIKTNNLTVNPVFNEIVTNSNLKNLESKNFKFETYLTLESDKNLLNLNLFKFKKEFPSKSENHKAFPTFVEKELETSYSIFKAEESLNSYLKDQLIKSTKIFSKSDFLKTETDLVSPRILTGYTYPDMKTSEVLKTTLLEKTFSTSVAEENNLIHLTPPTGALFSLDSNKTKNRVDLPTFQINSSGIVDSPIYYVELDENSKDVRVKNKFKIKHDVLEKLIQNNPVTLNQVYFFGNLTDEELKQSVTKLTYAINDWEASEKEKVSYDVSIFSEVEKTLFSVFDPKLDSSKSALFYQAKTNDLLGNKINKLIPILIFNQNDVENLLPLDINFTARDFNSSEKTSLTPYPFGTLKHLIDLENSKYSNTIFDIPGLNEYSSSSYKREVGLYWGNKLNNEKLGAQEFFKDSNQGITIESLFGISLIGFFLSMVSILRSAYSDYAKELSSYLLDVISTGKGLPLDPSTIEWLNEELGLEEKKGGIRVFPKGFSNKRFTEIAGIKNLLPELSELVWFLRNKGRKFSVTRLTTKSILLVGPPGTGKTLLVQTLAAEANVPVVAQSTNMLSSIGKDLTPADAIRMAFEKARSLAPAILFLDELDSLGAKRDSLLTNPAEELNLSTSNTTNNRQSTYKKFYQTENGNSFEDFEMGQVGVENSTDLVSNQLRINITNQVNKKLEQERDQISALTQLLVEIDGLQTNTGVLVIGATNRPAVLDPALTRPGRFSKVISVPLPDKAKRVEIIKLYAKPLGWDNDISWSYLSKCTQGFSAGDLAAMTNQSGIQAILNGTKHNLETFEHAIKILTTYPTEKVKDKNYFSLTQKTYYKTSQILLSYLLNSSNQPAFVELTPRQPNPRAFQINSNFINDEDRLRTRYELETILISLLAGKAGEILLLRNNYSDKYSYWESDLAKYDLYEATKTAITMISDWYFYSEGYKNIFSLKFTSIPLNLTHFEYRNQDEVFEFLKEMSIYLDQELTTQFRLPDLPVPFESLFQTARWKVDVTQELSNLDPAFSEWTRFHLPDPQQTERNPEWIPPEEHYSQLSTGIIQNNESSVEFEKLISIYIEKYLQYILLIAFNKAFAYLDENREVLDSLSFTLLQKRFIREPEIKKLIGCIN